MAAIGLVDRILDELESAMAGSHDVYADRAKRYLKAELKRAGVGYAELAKRLTDAGIPENGRLHSSEDQPRSVSGYKELRLE